MAVYFAYILDCQNRARDFPGMGKTEEHVWFEPGYQIGKSLGWWLINKRESGLFQIIQGVIHKLGVAVVRQDEGQDFEPVMVQDTRKINQIGSIPAYYQL